jgi:hypothetical protein
MPKAIASRLAFFVVPLLALMSLTQRPPGGDPVLGGRISKGIVFGGRL